MTEDVIIDKVKEVFSRYGICNVLRSDGGPQFQSKFKSFADEFKFTHIISSPYFSQSNGCVEAAVGTAKKLVKKNKGDMQVILWTYGVMVKSLNV